MGTATWNGLWIAGGHWLAPHMHQWHRPIFWAMGGIVVVLVLSHAWRVAHWTPHR